MTQNKAQQRLKEIEEKLEYCNKTINYVVGNRKELIGIERRNLEIEKQGILLGIEETKKEYEQKLKCQHKGCEDKDLIIVCHNHINTDFPEDEQFIKKDLLEKLKERIIIIRAETDTSLILIQKGKRLDFAEVKVVKWQDIEKVLR